MPTAPRLNPRTKRPAHDITLTDGIRTFGIKADPADIGEIPMTPSTLRLASGGGASAQKFGDFEPSMAQIVQADWSGGRGQDNFSDDPSRFFDSQGCWTLIPGKLLMGPLAVAGANDGVMSNALPGVYLPSGTTQHANVKWKSLLGTSRYNAAARNGGAFTAEYIHILIRKIGSPGTLTFEIRTDDGLTKPTTTVLKSDTVTSSSLDLIAYLYKFDWSGTQVLTGAVTYHFVVYGGSGDSLANHWEIGVDPDYSVATGSSISTDGTTWSSIAADYMYWGLVVTGDHSLTYFELDGSLYACNKNVDGTSATFLYMNGVRGKATSGSATTLVDSNLAMGTNTFSGASIRIINGTGVGQIRTITSNTSTAFTLPTWDITPDTSSEYVVYDTPEWQTISGHGLGAAKVTSVAVTGSLPGVAYFAQGTTAMRRMRFDATLATPAHGFAADGTNTADLLYTFYDEASKKVVVWRALNSNSQVARANAQSWGTDLTFGTGIQVGSTQYDINGLEAHDKKLYASKEDSLWPIENDTPSELPVGLRSSPDPSNGKAMKSLGLFLYFNYMHSVEQLYNSTLSDVGPWRGSGIPAGRTGVVSCMAAAFNWLFIGIDAGTGGTSSVFLYDGQSYHEIFRSPAVGRRIRSLYWQSNPEGRPRLWIECGSVKWSLPFPKNTLNPLNDSSFNYTNEGVLITSTMDMGSPRLPKFFKELTAISKNLTTGTEIRVDYQMDADVGGSSWIHLGSFLQPTEDTIQILSGNHRKIRFRLRLITDSSTTPTEVSALILEGFARTPVKYQYNIRFKQRPVQLNRRGGRDVDPDVLYNWLREAAGGAKRIRMRSRYKSMDNRDVIVEPPILRRQSADSSKSSWSGELSIILRDA